MTFPVCKHFPITVEKKWNLFTSGEIDISNKENIYIFLSGKKVSKTTLNSNG